MSLNGIDIASYQASLNPAAMSTTDFIIIKTTQGTGYVNPTWRRQADGTLRAGKLLGLYHYISGGDAAAEARYFADHVRPYIGRAVLALDWESVQNRAWGNVGYLRAVASEVIRLTGVRPLLYGSRAVYGQLSGVGRSLNCGLWIAEYASMRPTGWQGKPWHDGAYACAMRQYSSSGRIVGYGGLLDLDLFYGDRRAWMRYAAVNGKAQPAPQPVHRAPARPSRPQVRVDGYVGRDTIRLWQERMGTPVDGVISGQVVPRGYTRLALTSYSYGGGGSTLIRAVQRALNRQFPRARLTVDGLLGPRTILYLHAHEGVQVQSMRPWTNFGRGLGAAIQRSLNAGRW